MKTMKTFKELLKELNACTDAIIWAGDRSIEQVVEGCERGDWLLWLAGMIKVDKKQLVYTAALCAETVLHLMKDDRSIKAVQVAKVWGNGKVSDKELKSAAAAAHAAAHAAYTDTYDDAAAFAAYAAWAATYTAYAADTAYYAAADAVDAVDAIPDGGAATKANQQLTANIVREQLGEEIIKKVNELLKPTKQ